MDEVRTCKACGETKPITVFARRKAGGAVRHWKCAQCTYQAVLARRAAQPPTIPISQRCVRCKVERPANEFARDWASKTGLRPLCKECESARLAQYYQEHKEQRKAAVSTYQKSNPEKTRAAQKAAREKRKDYYNEYQRILRQNNYDRWRARMQRWREANRDKINVYGQQRRALEYNAAGSYSLEEWQTLKARYDFRCLMCGRQAPEVILTADHVIPLIKGGSNDIANIQPLCKNCNSSKKERILDFRPESML